MQGLSSLSAPPLPVRGRVRRLARRRGGRVAASPGRVQLPPVVFVHPKDGLDGHRVSPTGQLSSASSHLTPPPDLLAAYVPTTGPESHFAAPSCEEKG